jgi:pectinesterase
VGTGGITGTGGASSSGGTAAAGGSANPGGSVTTGGNSSTGGAIVTGGNSSTGGAIVTGGNSGTGGAIVTGGNSGTGGAIVTGGNPGKGGSVGSSADGLCPGGITKEIVVAADGSGAFKTVGDALKSIPDGSTTPTRINIKAGSYKEKLTISGRSHLCLVGENAKTTILTYDDNNASAGGTAKSASTTITADDFSAARLTFANSKPEGSGQAVALLSEGERQQYLDCRFLGYQDTLYPQYGTQYYRNCYVEGTVDFIFGGASAVFDNCEVVKVGSGSAITAPSTPKEVPFGLVFLGGKMTAKGGGSTALGRPWRADGMSAFIKVELGSHISKEGYVSMSGGGAVNDPKKARFGEYQNTGPGANPSARAGYQLSDSEVAKYTIPTILGGWVPSYSK